MILWVDQLKKNKWYFYVCSFISVKIRVGNHAGFSLYISESKCELPTGGYLCYKNQDKLPPLESDHVCKHHERYVTYYNKRTGDGADFPFKVTSISETTAEICEVQVFVTDGFFSIPRIVKEKSENKISGKTLYFNWYMHVFNLIGEVSVKLVYFLKNVLLYFIAWFRQVCM